MLEKEWVIVLKKDLPIEKKMKGKT